MTAYTYYHQGPARLLEPLDAHQIALVLEAIPDDVAVEMGSEHITGLHEGDTMVCIQTTRASQGKPAAAALSSKALAKALLQCRPGLEIGMHGLGGVYAVVFDEGDEDVAPYVVLDHIGYWLEYEGQAYDLQCGPPPPPGSRPAMTCRAA